MFNKKSIKKIFGENVEIGYKKGEYTKKYTIYLKDNLVLDIEITGYNYYFFPLITSPYTPLYFKNINYNLSIEDNLKVIKDLVNIIKENKEKIAKTFNIIKEIVNAGHVSFSITVDTDYIIELSATIYNDEVILVTYDIRNNKIKEIKYRQRVKGWHDELKEEIEKIEEKAEIIEDSLQIRLKEVII